MRTRPRAGCCVLCSDRWFFGGRAAVEGAEDGLARLEHQHRDERMRGYDRDEESEDWPMCWGKCFAGKCVLNQNNPGCCYLNHHGEDHSYGYTQDLKGIAQAAGSAAERRHPELCCWRGDDNGLVEPAT